MCCWSEYMYIFQHHTKINGKFSNWQDWVLYFSSFNEKSRLYVLHSSCKQKWPTSYHLESFSSRLWCFKSFNHNKTIDILTVKRCFSYQRSAECTLHANNCKYISLTLHTMFVRSIIWEDGIQKWGNPKATWIFYFHFWLSVIFFFKSRIRRKLHKLIPYLLKQ